MLTDEERDPAIHSTLLRQEATNMAIHLLVSLLEKHRLLDDGEFAGQVQRLATQIEKSAQPGSVEVASWLRKIYGGEQGSGDVIGFPNGKT